MITSMFALSTLHWIFSVTFTFVIVDLVNNDVKACYGRDNPYVCLARELAAKRGPTGSYLSLFNDILLINVSTVQYGPEYGPRTLTSADISRELTRLPEF